MTIDFLELLKHRLILSNIEEHQLIFSKGFKSELESFFKKYRDKETFKKLLEKFSREIKVAFINGPDCVLFSKSLSVITNISFLFEFHPKEKKVNYRLAFSFSNDLSRIVLLSVFVEKNKSDWTNTVKRIERNKKIIEQEVNFKLYQRGV